MRRNERLLGPPAIPRRNAELQREPLGTLFMQVPTPIAILRGSDHVFELANPEVCRLWGLDPGALMGRPLFEVLPELSGLGVRQILDDVLRTGTPFVGKALPMNSRDAAPRYFNLTWSPLRGADGAIEGVMGLGVDVTDEIVARNEVELLRKEAESANRAKDEFLAMLSHELRNPLSPIVTALELMRLHGVRSRELEILERQVGNLGRLVDDLLDVSRITRGKIELRKERVDLADTVASAVEIASPLLEQKRHELKLRVPPGLFIEADTARMAQVISNLLTNAAKYSDVGSTIFVKARRLGDIVQLSVADGGVGIDPQLLDRVFERFVQQPQTLERSKGGLGLGLAIVRSLVELHGGTVQAKSRGLGKGATFTVELPAAEPATEGAPSEDESDRQSDPADRKRILVVDDNPDVLRTLKDALETLGHTVRVANDGPAALRVLTTFEPEVGVLDIGLPVMDGYELARRLRERPGSSPDLRLIAVSGYGQAADRRRSAAAGFDRHLVKPIDLVNLERVLQGLA
jgi:PAS domain S-box-containing protein